MKPPSDDQLEAAALVLLDAIHYVRDTDPVRALGLAYVALWLNEARQDKDGRQVQASAKRPDSFTRREARAAVRRIKEGE